MPSAAETVLRSQRDCLASDGRIERSCYQNGNPDVRGHRIIATTRFYYDESCRTASSVLVEVSTCPIPQYRIWKEGKGRKAFMRGIMRA